MRWLLPKSLNGFLLLGLSVLAGPLLFAILNATLQMRELAATSQRLVADSVQTTRLSQDLYAQIALLERSARLYEVLKDDAVLAAFHQHDEQLSTTVEALSGQLRARNAHVLLSRLSDQQEQIRSLVLNGAQDRSAQLATAFVTLGDQAAGAADLSNQQIDADVGALQGPTDKATRSSICRCHHDWGAPGGGRRSSKSNTAKSSRQADSPPRAVLLPEPADPVSTNSIRRH